MITSREITAPLSKAVCLDLTVGQDILISGTIFTARDAAHKKLYELMESGADIPFDIKGAVIYYAGASPNPPGRIIGSIGPTTSGRMDAYTPKLLAAGLKGMIGKGPRSSLVVESIKINQAVYFGAVGGIGALLSQTVRSATIVAFPELGPEAIYKLEVEKFPARVLIDHSGKDYFERI